MEDDRGVFGIRVHQVRTRVLVNHKGFRNDVTGGMKVGSGIGFDLVAAVFVKDKRFLVMEPLAGIDTAINFTTHHTVCLDSIFAYTLGCINRRRVRLRQVTFG